MERYFDVEALAQVLHTEHARYGSRPWTTLSASGKDAYRSLATFVFRHCDEFTAANLLAHHKQTCVEREVEK